jgi:two-component system OmpR family sensor kinase
LRSIRRTLLAWLLLALAGGMALVMAATYAFAYAQITRVFDEEMVKVAQAAHLGEDWRGPGRLRIPHPGFNLSVRAYDHAGVTLFETPPLLPAEVPLLYETGLRVLDTGAGKWRLYSYATADGVVQVAQPESTRTSLARSLSLRMALPELVLIPVFVLFMAWVVRRGLAPLTQLTRRVEERDASRLEPLPADDVPLELKPLVAEINGLIGRLEQLMEAQRRFFAEAAHELRTPVAALALQAKVAQLTAQPVARAAAFAELDKGVARAMRLVEQLLKLAQLAPEAPRVAPQLVDLAELAREVVGSMAPAAHARAVDLGADAAGRVPVLGVPSELGSLIANLVDNALRYAPPDSEVTVKVAREDGAVVLSVVDAGPGIPAEERERVFERFGRATGDDTPGIGLGLAIVKAIVERHGGRIRLDEARPGGEPPGLAAHVVFPRKKEGAAGLTGA